MSECFRNKYIMLKNTLTSEYSGLVIETENENFTTDPTLSSDLPLRIYFFIPPDRRYLVSMLVLTQFPN